MDCCFCGVKSRYSYYFKFLVRELLNFFYCDLSDWRLRLICLRRVGGGM